MVYTWEIKKQILINHIEKRAVDLRQEIFEKIIKNIFASIEKQAVKAAVCTCGSALVKNRKRGKNSCHVGWKSHLHAHKDDTQDLWG